MTYQEALRYIDSLVNYELMDDYRYGDFTLAKMRRICESLGDPHRHIPSIHIAGSKGKGSTAAICHAILMEAGFTVGLYTSPHLISPRERIRVNDELIREDEFASFVARIRNAASGIEQEQQPTFFEFYTALAFLYFKERKVDFAVFETGLGGRLDATNVIQPLVCGITPISLEHTRILGPTLGAIAMEKSGIIKERAVCVSSMQEEEALSVIRLIARRRNVPLFTTGEHIVFRKTGMNGRKQIVDIFGVFGEYPGCELQLLGAHQAANAATAVGIVEGLRYFGRSVDQASVRRGIARAQWSGRLEVVRERPLIVLDGAQNRASASALARAVRETFSYRRLILILGISRDKDIEGICEELVPIANRVIVTRSRVIERALEPAALKGRMGVHRGQVVVTERIEDALAQAQSVAGEDDLILVTGSLFLVGEAKVAIRPDAQIP